MPEENKNNQIYKMFGVENYYKDLVKKGDTKNVKILEETISKYILANAVNELDAKGLRELEHTDLLTAEDIYRFFKTKITNFDQRVVEYGRSFSSRL